MKTLYIHIGHYKTGTSAIQKYCAEHAGSLACNGYYYPMSGRAGGPGTNHAALSLSLAAQHGFTPPPWYKGPRDVDEVYNQFVQEIRDAEQSNILVSSEEFFQLALRKKPEAAIAELKSRLEEFDTKIVMYIREPMALLKSWHNEVNKGPFGTGPFLTFFKNLNPNFLSQVAVYDQFAAAFGSSNIIVRSYKKTGMAHICDFLEGINYPDLPSDKNPLVVNEAQDINRIELNRIDKRRKHGHDDVSVSKFGTVAQLESRIDKINASFKKIADRSDEELTSDLSLFNIISYLRTLLQPLIEQNRINPEAASLLRDAALSIEKTDPDLALLMMQTAHEIRPNGDFIKKKLQAYKSDQ